VDPKWVAEVLAELRAAPWRDLPVARRGAVTFRKQRLPLVFKCTTGGYWDGWICLWYVEDDCGVIAAGTARVLRERRHVLELGCSAVAEPARQQGLYTAVLRELVRIFDGPIESDAALTPGARGAWLRAGGQPARRADHDVLRLEPPRR